MATVKGTWRFNGTIDEAWADYTASYGRVEEPVNFTSGMSWGNVKNFCKFQVRKADSDNLIICYIFTDGSYYYTQDVYHLETRVWEDVSFQTVDFGTTEQEVSDEFYAWFTANATPQAKAKVFKRLYSGDAVATSGTRVFKKLTPSVPVITDLTGTTWVISAFSATAGYGVFDVSGKCSLRQPLGYTFTAINHFSTLRIGYAVESSADNSLCWDNTDGTQNAITSNQYRYDEFTFTGGTDVTNTRLINWMLENCKLASPIVGTWVFNNTIAELPIFDDTLEDTYDEYGRNRARYISVNLAYSGTTMFKPVQELAMYNITHSADGGTIDTVCLGSMGVAPEAFYFYDTNTYAEGTLWGDADNELTFLGTSKFTNYSGVDVREKFLAYLKANARKK